MQKLGKEIKLREVADIIAHHDKTRDGMLNFDEYRAIFQQDEQQMLGSPEETE